MKMSKFSNFEVIIFRVSNRLQIHQTQPYHFLTRRLQAVLLLLQNREILFFIILLMFFFEIFIRTGND